MKKIFLIRHAEAVTNPDIPDIERPLSENGRRGADTMAKRLLNLGIKPDIMISSTAQRAIDTARIFGGILNVSKPCLFKDIVYEAMTVDSLLNVIGEINNLETVTFLFGHNPRITRLANALSPDFKSQLPPCGVVGLELDIAEWSDIVPACGKLILFETV